MTDAAGAPRDDIQRPLDESVPADVTRGSADPPAPLAGPLGRPVEPSDLPVPPAEPAAPAPGPANSEPDGDRDLRSATPVAEPEPGIHPEPRPAGPVDEPEGDPALRPAVPAASEPSGAATGAPAPGRVAAALAGVGRVAQRLARVPGRTLRAVVAWSRRPSGRLAVPGLVTATLVAATVSTGAFLIPSAGVTVDPDPAAPPSAGQPTGVPTGVPAPVAPSPAAPIGTPGTPAPAQEPPRVLRNWAGQMSDRTGIPPVALQAYGYAELVLARTLPGCRLSWTTLAAIGQVESNHGSAGGATLLADGRALPRVTGLPLDGNGGRDNIPDTDRGTLDGDRTYDRAVGPMQFIPSSWRLARVDASGDGFADINNINDAALAAANYLCDGVRNLSTPDDWWAAILSYNNVQSYAEEVFATANEYGRLSRG